MATCSLCSYEKLKQREAELKISKQNSAILADSHLVLMKLAARRLSMPEIIRRLPTCPAKKIKAHREDVPVAGVINALFMLPGYAGNYGSWTIRYNVENSV